MNKIRYAVIILFTLMPFVTIPMDRKLALAKSRQESRVKSAQGEYVTPRSNERKQQSSALAQAPVYGATEQTTKSAGRQLSQTPHVTIRKKVANIDEGAQTLYDQAIFLHPEKQNSHLNHDTSIAQKIGFDQSIKRGNVRQTVAFLNAKNGLKTSYPLAIKLYAIMISEACMLEIHPSEAAIIPVADIRYMENALANFGDNQTFFAKIGFDESIKCGNAKMAIRFLNAPNKLKTIYPLGKKLHEIMMSKTDELDIDPTETALIPVRDICLMAKKLAQHGGNERFLENYARIMHENPEMRKIINGDQ